MSMSTSACPSGDEKVELFALLLETNARLSRSLALVLESRCELPLPWFEVLLQLRKSQDGRLKMHRIADAIVHSTGGTTRLIDRLEEANLVARESCPSDRRAVYVAITSEGNRRLDEALDVHLDYLEGLLGSRLSGPERATLTELLKKLNEPR
ncbi:MAG: MarR family transcriptional regulator [Acidimicrobiaceae bacterium]|nr:MarR family transcriptional regulator [Acidimicrobiaceae bacterium]